MDVFDPAVGLEKSKRMFEEANQRKRRGPPEPQKVGYVLFTHTVKKVCTRLRDCEFPHRRTNIYAYLLLVVDCEKESAFRVGGGERGH